MRRAAPCNLLHRPQLCPPLWRGGSTITSVAAAAAADRLRLWADRIAILHWRACATCCRDRMCIRHFGDAPLAELVVVQPPPQYRQYCPCGNPAPDACISGNCANCCQAFTCPRHRPAAPAAAPVVQLDMLPYCDCGNPASEACLTPELCHLLPRSQLPASLPGAGACTAAAAGGYADDHASVARGLNRAAWISSAASAVPTHSVLYMVPAAMACCSLLWMGFATAVWSLSDGCWQRHTSGWPQQQQQRRCEACRGTAGQRGIAGQRDIARSWAAGQWRSRAGHQTGSGAGSVSLHGRCCTDRSQVAALLPLARVVVDVDRWQQATDADIAAALAAAEDPVRTTDNGSSSSTQGAVSGPGPSAEVVRSTAGDKATSMEEQLHQLAHCVVCLDALAALCCFPASIWCCACPAPSCCSSRRAEAGASSSSAGARAHALCPVCREPAKQHMPGVILS